MTDGESPSRAPSLDELKQCFQLEQTLTPDAPEAERQGFFLPGVQFETYQNLFSSGYIRVIVENASVHSFILVAPPSHAIVHRLLNERQKLLWFDPDYPAQVGASAYWIAKIATTPSARRRGHAAALYRQCFTAFSHVSALTATAVSPKRNHASEDFHRALGFRPVGLFLSGHRPDFGEVVNLVWERRATS